MSGRKGSDDTVPGYEGLRLFGALRTEIGQRRQFEFVQLLLQEEAVRRRQNPFR